MLRATSKSSSRNNTQIAMYKSHWNSKSMFKSTRGKQEKDKWKKKKKENRKTNRKQKIKYMELKQHT